MIRPCFALVNLGNLAHNLRQFCQRISPGTSLMAVVKADAYGHGAIPVAQAALGAGARWLAVALTEEAIELRKAGITAPILLLGGLVPDALFEILQHQITPAVYSLETLKMVQDFAQAKGVKLGVHLKLDTGMGRLGLNPTQFELFLNHLADYAHLEVQGLMTHFSSADDDPEYTALQELRFEELRLKSKGRLHPHWVHLCNSAGVEGYGEAGGNLVRIGIGMYGLPPSPAPAEPLDLKEVMQVKACIIQLQRHPAGTPLSYGQSHVLQRDSLIATLGVGYADGYPRALSNQGRVLVRGTSCPIVGRVTMDMTLIDVTDLPRVELFDLVTLMGREGAEAITAGEIAALTNTIHYEVTCNIAKRVPRIYHHD